MSVSAHAENANTQAEDIVDIKDNNETEAESELINFEWEGQSENGNEPLPDDEPLDDGFNEMDEIILNETINTEADGGGSVQEVFSDFDNAVCVCSVLTNVSVIFELKLLLIYCFNSLGSSTLSPPAACSKIRYIWRINGG